MRSGDKIETNFGERTVLCECNSTWDIEANSASKYIHNLSNVTCSKCDYYFWVLKDEIEPKITEVK